MTDSVRTRKAAKKWGRDRCLQHKAICILKSPCHGLVPYLQRRFHPCFFSLPSAHELKITTELPLPWPNVFLKYALFMNFLQSVYLQGKIFADPDHWSLLFITAMALRQYRFLILMEQKNAFIMTGGVIQSGWKVIIRWTAVFVHREHSLRAGIPAEWEDIFLGEFQKEYLHGNLWCRPVFHIYIAIILCKLI